VLFFKFPPKFKLDFPRVIGDYNPDWGVVRFDEQGKAKLHLVRETKGTTDLEKLQFSHEAVKIKCAERYFVALGIDYRVVDLRVAAWWSREDSVPIEPLGFG
jgi:type III restriction enzyme